VAVEETYATIAQIDTYATDNGYDFWLTKTSSEKTRANVEATKQISRYHRQEIQPGASFEFTGGSELWLATNEDLIKANIIQAIYIVDVRPSRDVAKQINEIATGSYNDGNVSVAAAAGQRLDPDAKYLVDKALLENNKNNSRTYGR
jgi:hypothetical protein